MALTKKLREYILDDLVEALIEIKDREEMKDFLVALLTPAEYQSIPLRLAIVKMLKNDIPQREIVKRLGVGVATVTRGSKELKLKHFRNDWWRDFSAWRMNNL